VAFRCALEKRDDDTGNRFLENKTSNRLVREYFLHREEEGKGGRGKPKDKLFLLFNFANMAEKSNMTETARKLYAMCVALCEVRANCAPTPNASDDEATLLREKVKLSTLLAKNQRKLISLASSVKSCVSVFEAVAEKCIIDYDEKDENDGMAVAPAPAPKIQYNQHEISWFCIDAYNRGVNLMYLGDEKNSEVLLASALNMLPHCSGDVRFHANIIREAYSKSCEINERGQHGGGSGNGNGKSSNELRGNSLFVGVCPTAVTPQGR